MLGCPRGRMVETILPFFERPRSRVRPSSMSLSVSRRIRWVALVHVAHSAQTSVNSDDQRSRTRTIGAAQQNEQSEDRRFAIPGSGGASPSYGVCQATEKRVSGFSSF
jgi:hypothetical protein